MTNKIHIIIIPCLILLLVILSCITFFTVTVSSDSADAEVTNGLWNMCIPNLPSYGSTLVPYSFSDRSTFSYGNNTYLLSCKVPVPSTRYTILPLKFIPEGEYYLSVSLVQSVDFDSGYVSFGFLQLDLDDVDEPYQVTKTTYPTMPGELFSISELCNSENGILFRKVLIQGGIDCLIFNAPNPPYDLLLSFAIIPASLVESPAWIGYSQTYDKGYNSGFASGISDDSSTSKYAYQNGYSNGVEAGIAEGYNSGVQSGYTSGHSAGYTSGKTDGYNIGYSDGVEASNNYSFTSLLSAVIDVPVNAFYSLFNFDVLGTNMSGFILSLFTLSILLLVVKLVVFGGGF